MTGPVIDREVHKVGKVVTREWRKAKVLNWNLYSFQLLEIIQVLDSISWVRCASGNVYVKLQDQWNGPYFFS